jgi:hypothetical protein
MQTTIVGRTVEYQVNEKTGEFSASYNGEKYAHMTLAGLKGILERQLKKKPLDIGVIEINSNYGDNMTIRHGRIMGVHSGNNNLMVQWRGDTALEQYKSYYSDALLKRDTDLKKLQHLFDKMKAASDAYNEFVQESRFDRSVVKEQE